MQKFKHFIIEKKTNLQKDEAGFCQALISAIDREKYDEILDTIETYDKNHIDQRFRYVFYSKICEFFAKTNEFSEDNLIVLSSQIPSWEITCTRIKMDQFDDEIYPLIVNNNCLYYLMKGQSYIAIATLFANEVNRINIRILDIEFNRNNCKHIFWKNIIFIFVFDSFDIFIHGYCLREHKKVCFHTMNSNVNLSDISLILYKDYLLFVRNRSITVLHVISLPLLLVKESKNLLLKFSENCVGKDLLTFSPSRPILFASDRDQLIVVLDANEPSISWKSYIIEEELSSTISLKLVPVPVLVNQHDAPIFINDEGVLPINNGKQVICLGFSTCHNKYQVYICNNNSPVTFYITDCEIPFEKDKIYSLLSSADSDLIYILEWNVLSFHRRLERFMS